MNQYPAWKYVLIIAVLLVVDVTALGTLVTIHDATPLAAASR